MPKYQYNLPDLDTQQKMLQIAGAYGPNIDPDYERYKLEGQRSLQQNFGAAQQRIGAQFSPLMRMAQSRLGGSPLLADSGYSNRLNRQLQQGAFGQLSDAYGEAAAGQSRDQLSALERLIQTRIGSRQDILAQIMGSAQKKKNFGDYAGAAIGTGLGAWAGGGFK